MLSSSPLSPGAISRTLSELYLFFLKKKKTVQTRGGANLKIFSAHNINQTGRRSGAAVSAGDSYLKGQRIRLSGLYESAWFSVCTWMMFFSLWY